MSQTTKSTPPLIGPTTPTAPLTFGIEIEFALAGLFNNIQLSPHPHPSPQVYGIFTGPYSLSRHGYTAYIMNAINAIIITLTSVGVMAEMTIFKEKCIDTKAWAVTWDESIAASVGEEKEEEEEYYWAPIEINSPIFTFSEQKVEREFKEIELVCRTLKNRFKIECNHSAGVHVHVGRGEQGFKFETIQKLLATLWTLEPQIERIHPIHRRENAAFCPGLREGTVCGFQAHLRGDRNWMDEYGNIDPELADEESYEDERALYFDREGVSLLAGGMGEKECDEKAGLEALLNAKSIAKLKYLVRTHDRSATRYGPFKCAYHIGNVEANSTSEYETEVKRTVEFRQHQSTLDFERLKHWVGFCVGVVRFVEEIEMDVLRPWLRGVVKEDRGLESVLRVMGLYEEADYYKARIVEDRETDVPVSRLPELEQCSKRLWAREEREEAEGKDHDDENLE